MSVKLEAIRYYPVGDKECRGTLFVPYITQAKCNTGVYSLSPKLHRLNVVQGYTFCPLHYTGNTQCRGIYMYTFFLCITQCCTVWVVSFIPKIRIFLPVNILLVNFLRSLNFIARLQRPKLVQVNVCYTKYCVFNFHRKREKVVNENFLTSQSTIISLAPL